MKKFMQGMHKDVERVDQPEGSYRDALNATLYYRKGAIVNEQGTISVGVQEFPITNIIGQCVLEDDRIVLFAIDASPENNNIIAVVYPKVKSYTVIYRNNDLNYQPSNPIEATSKIDSKNQIKVYFTDNYISKLTNPETGIEYLDDYNPPRVFDVTKQEVYLAQPGASNTILYGNNNFNIDKLDLFMHSGLIPEFIDVDIKEGGGAISGTYHLAIAYVDEDRNETNYLVTSNAVHLVADSENSVPTESISGNPKGTQTNKSIDWKVNIPKGNYTFVKPVVIQRFGGGQNQESSQFAYELDFVKIPDTGEFIISYSGLETVAPSTIEEVIVDNIRYETAKTIVQLDGRLYMSNLQARGDIGYQRFANYIQLDAVTEEIKRFDPRKFDIYNINKGYNKIYSRFDTPDFTLETAQSNFYYDVQTNDHPDLDEEQSNKFSGKVRKGYKDVSLSYKKRSFRRSEVYAFYISFVFKDGIESYAYHIPGRKAEIINNFIRENDALSSGVPVGFENFIGLNTAEIELTNPDAHIHQVTDTQIMLSEIAGVEKSTSYWENSTEKYPDTDDFETWSVSPTGDPINENDDLKYQNVRHHKMPSNKHKDYSFIKGIDQNDPSTFNFTNNFEANSNQSSFEMFEDIRLLEIKLSNISIPKFILKQIQGYKIYYAKRNQKDKTVLGQSVSVPSVLRANSSVGMDRRVAKYGPYHRAFYMYGGIPPGLYNYIGIESPLLNNNKYLGFPVFAFHDFNLLKNKHTLTGASHVDIQNILTFRTYAGGNGSTPSEWDADSNGTSYFYRTGWVSPEIGNSVDPESDEDNFSTSVKAFVTSVMMATSYAEPNAVNYIPGYGMQGNDKNKMSNIQTIYSLQPKGATYLPGHTHLDVHSSGSFHGAKYLYNFAGESSIAISLYSGLPAIKGYSNVLTDLIVGDSATSKRFAWYPAGGFYNPNDIDNAVDNSTLSFFNQNNTIPAGYLINLCSIKSDVYKSFDEQQLVWTGYYKSLSDVSLDTGNTKDLSQNYYNGAESDSIFGGDTYITRYGFRTTSQSYGHSFWDLLEYQFEEFGFNAGYYSDIPLSLENRTSGSVTTFPGTLNMSYTIDKITGSNSSVIPPGWNRGNNTPVATIFYFFCESDDLIGYRHSSDAAAGVTEEKSRFFDNHIAASVLFNSPINDNTHIDNLLYMNNYSAVQDLRVAIPLPKKVDNIKFYPTRTIRSKVEEGVSDKYRKFLALEYKDITKDKGDIWDIFTVNSTLCLHTEKSMFMTRGDQTMQLGDNTEAYIGSGNIFAQDPQEISSAVEGYAGTDCQTASISTKYGQFFVNKKERKVYLMTGSVEDLSSQGMENWFIKNMPYKLEVLFNFNLDNANVATDAPTEYFGFTSAYDAKYKRIILTKKEVVPKKELLGLISTGRVEIINNTFQYTDLAADYQITLYGDLNDFGNTSVYESGGWTISYYPEAKFWGSRHSYKPNLYAYTRENYYSLINNDQNSTNQVWEHNDFDNPGSFYGTTYNFEFEYIDNSNLAFAKIFSTVYYWAEVQSNSSVNVNQTHRHTSPGFTSFYIYNTQQISGGSTDINYLSNARLVDKLWYVNDFRDLSRNVTLTNTDLVTGIPNVQDDFTTGVESVQDTITMFLEEGVVNTAYLDNNKQWYNQKRFVDHYLGVRLICDNSAKNLVHLYAAGTKHRNSYR